MQARESEQQHDDEHRVLSSSTNSSTTDERHGAEAEAVALKKTRTVNLHLHGTEKLTPATGNL